MPPPDTGTDALASLQQSDYLSARIDPRPGEPFYLHLSDLWHALQPLATADPVKLLDYGAGGSPYRSLFPNADYRRADFEAVGRVDYVLKGEDTTIPEPDGTFDLILSTQVAEHLRHPQNYLAECLRLLRPGGRLVCTTHGTFEDHGCPYDYQRWTAAGLRHLLEDAGFEVAPVHKLTTGPRALLFQIDLNLWRLRVPGFSGWSLFMRAANAVHWRARGHIHRQADRYFAGFRDVVDPGDQHPFYVALLASARKPA